MNSNAKKLAKVGGLSIFFILILGYALFISKDLVFGVKIKDVSLSDWATVSENVIQVTGNAKNAINLSLNGREISVDEQGNFRETIAILSGYNVIHIEAQDKFGYTDEKNYKLMY